MEFLILDHCVGFDWRMGPSGKSKWSGGGDLLGIEFGVGTGIEPWNSVLKNGLSEVFGLPVPIPVPYPLPPAPDYVIAGEKCYHRAISRI